MADNGNNRVMKWIKGSEVGVPICENHVFDQDYNKITPEFIKIIKNDFL